jgi:hypothetical protein
LGVSSSKNKAEYPKIPSAVKPMLYREDLPTLEPPTNWKELSILKNKMTVWKAC